MVYDEKQRERIYSWREKNREEYLALRKKNYDANKESLKAKRRERYYRQKIEKQLKTENN
jgi:hypothetical protein